ncbi:hypothetical protein GBAR_LOCUS15949 [Geodia barretti]|uniref:Uncharacterized protein n=1 Tax=Geodia barretti TaxID=519541 RepID=A0AA35SF61_GEOBA|nr:hypothetical protein GBAR_LOCUS15949 [Geodia barretti]
MAVYRTFAHAHCTSEVANRQRLHAVLGYDSTRSLYDLSSSYTGGAARSHNHFHRDLKMQV